MKLFFFTNSSELASHACASGVDRIVVDLEILGKVERQGHLNTLISSHTFEDLEVVRRAVPAAEVMARLNPVYEGSKVEIDRAIAIGVNVLMLPMFRHVHEVEEFSSAVAGRCRICLLTETVGAIENLEKCAMVRGVDEVHIGLNDLHLEMGLRFMFEPFASGLMDQVSAVLRGLEMPFGIGGIARCGEGLLPAELILSEHARLGSTAAILSRTFHRQAASVSELEGESNFALEIAKLREAYRKSMRSSPAELWDVHKDVQGRIANIITPVDGHNRQDVGG